MNTLPMVREPLWVHEFYFRPFDEEPVRMVGCPAWGCDWTCNTQSAPYLWLEHLRSHRYEPFTMHIPRKGEPDD